MEPQRLDGDDEQEPPLGIMEEQIKVGILLFNGFEVLDVFGPIEMFGNSLHFEICTISEKEKTIRSTQGHTTIVVDHTFDDCPAMDWILVPGGPGTRKEVNNEALIRWIQNQSKKSSTVFSVCTGAALLAKAGVLDGKKATTNKKAFRWVADQGPEVNWIPCARWVEDGKFVSSSGVSVSHPPPNFSYCHRTYFLTNNYSLTRRPVWMLPST